MHCRMFWLPVAVALVVAACESVESPTAAASEELAEESWLQEGQSAYARACASCHEAGIEGAPITGNADDWSDRSPLWMAVLAEHAEKGYRQMPEKGGDSELSERAVQAATDYMLSVAHPDLPMDQ